MIAAELNRHRDSGKRITYTAKGVERSFTLKTVIHEDGEVFLFYTDYGAWGVEPETEVVIEG